MDVSKKTLAAAKMLLLLLSHNCDEVRNRFCKILTSGGLEVHLSYICSSSVKIGNPACFKEIHEECTQKNLRLQLIKMY